MTRVRLTAVFLCLFIAAAHAEEKSIAGQWKVAIDVSGNGAGFTCTIAQEGKDLKGNCGTLGELTGIAKDGVYTWGTTGGQSALTFTGKLNADGNLTGTVDVLAYGVNGDFKGTPLK